jgi:hypothetical protein
MDPWTIEEKNISCYCLHMGGLVVSVHTKHENKCTYIGVIYGLFLRIWKSDSLILQVEMHICVTICCRIKAEALT